MVRKSFLLNTRTSHTVNLSWDPKENIFPKLVLFPKFISKKAHAREPTVMQMFLAVFNLVESLIIVQKHFEVGRIL